MIDREQLIELLNKYFSIGDSDFYICNRVKEAFTLGTMSLDDFSEIDEEIISDIADYLISNNMFFLPCKVGDVLFFANRTIGEVVEAKIISVEMNYYTEPKLWLTIEYQSPYTGRQELKARIDLLLNKYLFFNRKEAEISLKG